MSSGEWLAHRGIGSYTCVDAFNGGIAVKVTSVVPSANAPLNDAWYRTSPLVSRMITPLVTSPLASQSAARVQEPVATLYIPFSVASV